MMKKDQPKGYSYEACGYCQFQLILVQEGELVATVHKQEHKLRPGRGIILRQGSTFRLACPRRGYSGWGVQALTDLPSAWTGEAQVFDSDSGMRAVLQLIETNHDRPALATAGVLRGLALTLAWQAVDVAQRRESISATDWAETARSALDVSAGAGIAARTALASLPIGYRQVSRHFREAFGITPKQYQLQVRLDEARRLLGDPRQTVTAVAMETGFSSSQHFATRFRAAFGCTPSAYRRGA